MKLSRTQQVNNLNGPRVRLDSFARACFFPSPIQPAKKTVFPQIDKMGYQYAATRSTPTGTDAQYQRTTGKLEKKACQRSDREANYPQL